MADANEVMALFNEIYTNIDQTNVQAANKTGTGKFVLQNSPTINSPIFISPIGVGPVSFTPTYTLDVRSNSGASQIHVSRNSSDVGGYITQATSDHGLALSAGMAYNGTNWVAKATVASLIDQESGNVSFYGDTGLVVGNTFSPTGRLFLRANGDLWLNSTAKLALDGGGDTYISETAANTLSFVTGGTAGLVTNATSIAVPATNRVYLDGGSDTSIRESAANTITFQAGGTDYVSIGGASDRFSITGGAASQSALYVLSGTGAASAQILQRTSSSTATTRAALNIIDGCNNAPSAIEIQRDANSASDVSAIDISSISNAGAGNAIGIDLTATMDYQFSFPVNATDPTGGGGAATGRIPVLIGGVTRYLAYY